VKRAFRSFLLLVGPCLILSACATGSSLHVPGDLTRPPRAVAAPGAGAPQAVIADFSFAAVPGGIVGRDYDRARQIVWNGEPGKAMADLVAAVLGERGVATIRRGSSASLSDLFVTPDDIREALLSTANTVAEEVARTLIEAKAVSPTP